MRSMVVSVENMADISIEVNEINVVSVENMADISIEVNEINVVEAISLKFQCLFVHIYGVYCSCRECRKIKHSMQ